MTYERKFDIRSKERENNNNGQSFFFYQELKVERIATGAISKLSYTKLRYISRSTFAARLKICSGKVLGNVFCYNLHKLPIFSLHK
jgi:hypothetical protein